MKVYLVWDDDYESANVVGIYDNKEAADLHAAHEDYWVEEEDVRSAFVPPSTPEAPAQCSARSITLSEREGIQCRLMRGHDGPHECLP